MAYVDMEEHHELGSLLIARAMKEAGHTAPQAAEEIKVNRNTVDNLKRFGRWPKNKEAQNRIVKYIKKHLKEK